MPPKKKLSRGCLSNWCDADADADADSSKTILLSRPPPYRGVDIIIPAFDRIYIITIISGTCMYVNVVQCLVCYCGEFFGVWDF